MTDLADLCVSLTRELAQVRWERDAYRVWFRASLDKLHEQYVDLEQERRTSARLRGALTRRRDEAA